MLGDEIFRHDAAADQVLLDDPLEHRRIALAVPGAFRIDDGDRAALADAQAVRLRPQDAALVRELQFLQAPLQEVPRGQAALLVAALRVRLVAAEKDVTPGDWDADGRRDVAL